MALDLTFKPFSGVGIATFYRRNAVTGLPSGGGYDLGETVKLDITNTAPKLEMNTSRSPDRGVAYSMAQSKTGAVSIEVKTVNDFIWGLLTSGSWTEAAAGAPVVGWTAPVDLVAGQYLKLPHQNVSAVVIKDSAGSPATLEAGTHYETGADPLIAGAFKLKDVSGFTQPFKVDYTPGAVKVLGAMKAPDEDFILFFDSTNAYDNSRQLLEVYRFRFAPEGALSFVSDGSQFPSFTLNGSIQKDETKAVNSAGGQYYKLVTPGG